MAEYRIVCMGPAVKEPNLSRHQIGTDIHREGVIDVWFGDNFNIKSPTAALKIARKIVKALNAPEK
jgi:hypothetical protein